MLITQTSVEPNLHRLTVFYHPSNIPLYAALPLSNPHTAACVLLRGLVQHVLSPRCARRNILELDCLQALGIKRYTSAQRFMPSSKNPLFKPLSNPRIKIWRYTDFTKFVSLLEDEALFFCRPALDLIEMILDQRVGIVFSRPRQRPQPRRGAVKRWPAPRTWP